MTTPLLKWTVLWTVAFFVSHCADDCMSTLDCNPGKICVSGECVVAEQDSDDDNRRDSQSDAGDNDPSSHVDGHDTSPSDTDSSSTEDPPPDACTGDDVWHDPATKVCWYTGFLDLTGRSFTEAVSLCESIVTADQPWHLPLIQELTTAIRGCNSANDCELHDPDCLDQECLTTCNQISCTRDDGPIRGCYVKSALIADDGCGIYWSSSIKSDTTDGDYAFTISTTTGGIQDLDVYFPFGGYVTCAFIPEA